MMLDSLVGAGCDVADVDDGGWNCLFYCVLCALTPSRSKDLQVLVHLLKHFNDILAKDSDGMTVFDYVGDTSGTYGSYRRDLWTTALARAGYGGSGSCIRHAVYTPKYLPEYHLAMRHLHSWTPDNVASELRLLAANHSSLRRDIFQILAQLHSLREETSRSEGVLVTARTIRVGTSRPSMRPQVTVVRGALRSVTRDREEPGRAHHNYFRIVRMAGRRPF